MISHSPLLASLKGHVPDMIDDLSALVTSESPSADIAACASCAAIVSAIGTNLLGQPPEVVTIDGHSHLRWRFGAATRVALIGHLDTVWPLGTTARWPFAVRGGIATGPGVFDMKAGIVQAFYALASLDDLDGVAVLFTSDEEVGSLTSRALVEATATGCRAALVLEPSAGGALKVARKGTSLYDLQVTGRAAHAGLEPERGANATVEMAKQILASIGLARPEIGTTVTPTVAGAGTTINTVPAAAHVHIDVRAESPDEQSRVDEALRAVRAQVPGTTVHVAGGINRPPLPISAASELAGRARRLAEQLGLGDPGEIAVGGGSDGNFTAGIGVPTLDGLGAVGEGAHAEGEHVMVAAMPERAALLAALVHQLL